MSILKGRYPECEKLAKVSEKSQELGVFLEWLMGEYHLCNYDHRIEQYWPTHNTVENILAEYFHIDMEEVNRERAQMLEELRNVQ